jgi:hypothetical protein
MRVLEWTAIVFFGIVGFGLMGYAIYLQLTLFKKRK